MVSIFAASLVHAVRDGASVGQTGAGELQETSFLQSLHVAQPTLKRMILLPQLPKCWDNRCVRVREMLHLDLNSHLWPLLVRVLPDS